MYKNLFFDFDGTLFNGYPHMLGAFIRVFKEKRNMDITYEELFALSMHSFIYMGEKLNITQDEWDYYNYIINNESDTLPPFVPFEDTKYLLEELKKRKIDCYIYTNRDEKTFEYLKQFDLFDYFKDFIIDAQKPSVGPLDYMIAKYNLKKEECLVIGDRELDVDSARASNIDSFALYDYKIEEKATHQGKDFASILNLIDSQR